MKKRTPWFLVIIAAGLGWLLTACGSTAEVPQPPEEDAAKPAIEAPAHEDEAAFSFADLADLEFSFVSGAGGWRTVLTVQADGTFAGEYLDSDLKVVYLCNFTGAFTEPVRVDAYTYSVRLERLELEREPDTQEVRDGITYIYSEPYGLDGAEECLFYLPGTPAELLSEECLNWMKGWGDAIGGELPFYDLCNVNAQQGFSSHRRITIDEELAAVEQESESLQKMLETQSSLSQGEMNSIAAQRYQLWDAELNLIWSRLQAALDAETMDTLTAEELAWIAEKDAAMRQAGLEVEGGSLRPIFEYGEGTKWTRERVYQLAQYLR